MRLTDTPPPYCSGCFGQYHVPHVDFESDWDGPVFNRDGIRTTIDDLILCEKCVRAAYELLPKSKEDKVVEKLKAQLGEVQKENKMIHDYAHELETAIAKKPK